METHDQMIEARVNAALDAKKKFYAALAKAQAEMKNPQATNINAGVGRAAKYVDLGTLRDAVVPALNKHGFAVIQTSRIDHGAPGDGSEAVARVAVDTLLTHEGGHAELFRGVSIPAIGRDGRASAHAIGGAQTYGRRYSLSALCAVASDKDDDGNDISGIVASGVKGAPSARKPMADDVQWGAALKG